MTTHDDSEDRTTPMGLFNYAHSYYTSAEALKNQNLRCTHPNAPMNYLYAHALELYLKAFLRQNNVCVDELKKINHSATKLINAASSYNLQLPEIQKEQLVLGLNSMGFRYIKTGYGTMLMPEVYSGLCRTLDIKIRPIIYTDHT